MEKATNEQIVQLVREAEILEASDDIHTDNSLEDQGFDSIDFLKLYLAVEEKYGIKIPDADMPGLATVASITAYVNEKALS